MKTKPIDYTGCHPEIAECLKRGEACLCRLKNYDSGLCQLKTHVIGYIKCDENTHYLTECNDYFLIAEPVKTITKVKKASEIVKWLEDNGYEFVESKLYGNSWRNHIAEIFFIEMFGYCGNEPRTDKYKWRPEWLEEVEECKRKSQNQNNTKSHLQQNTCT